MQPMQPFAPFPSSPTPTKNKAPLSAALRTILGLKLVGVLFVMGASFIFVLSFNDTHVEGENRELLRQLGNIAILGMVTSFVELVGIAGTWAMKRWGAYTLIGFSMITIALSASAHDTGKATFGALSTLLVALMIAPRWSDFD